MTTSTFALHTAATTVALLCLTAAAATAQTQVMFPHDHATVEGRSLDNTNHLTMGAGRVQIVYEQWDTRFPANAKLGRFAFRQDGGFATPGLKVQAEVLMGLTDRDVGSPDSTFANNDATTPTPWP